jgi:hypothetical protein
MMLNESNGIQTQNTATSGNSSIRIQGLDGNIQIFKRWFSSFSGASKRIIRIANTAIRFNQVEIFKRSASTHLVVVLLLV